MPTRPQGGCPFRGTAPPSRPRPPGASLHAGLKPSILPLDLLWGMYPGPMGCTAALVLGAAALFLLARRCIRPESIVCFLLTAALAAALFPRIACPALTSVKYELLTGSLLFCAVFLLGDPVTSPRTTVGRCLFGVLAGGLLMAMRQTGSFEQTACFAVLIADAFAPVLDHAAIRLRAKGGAAAMKETARELRAVFGNGFLFYNPVLTAALSLYPAAVCASLSQALPVSLLLLVQSLLAALVLWAVGSRLPDWLRPGVVFAVSAVCWIPAALLAERAWPGSLSLLGTAAGLQIANSMVLSRLNEYAPTHILPAVAADVLGCTLGTGVLLSLQAALRGWLASGSVWGETGVQAPFAGALGSAPAKPFFGFLVLGVLAAAVQALNARRARRVGKRRVSRL